MAIYVKRVGESWCVSVHQAEVLCQDLAQAALSAMDLSEKLGQPIEFGADVPVDALTHGLRLREELQRKRSHSR